MKYAVVTGAAGFVGCNLVEALIAHGYFVYGVVRPKSQHNSRLAESNQLKLVAADMSEFGRLAEMIGGSADIFFHAAWQGGRYDFAEQNQNIAATLAALRAAKALGCKRFVATGSQAEYGPKRELITEGCLPQPIDAYGSAKLAACVLSRQLAADLGMEWIWGRIFSVYGKYEPAGRMLPDLLQSLIAGESFELSAANQYWDYLYSSDCANALVALGEYGRSGEIYNIANGDCRPLKAFTEEMRESIAPDVQLKYGKNPKVVYSLWVSPKKLMKDTGWKPKIEFHEGIRLMSNESGDKR